MDSHDIRIKTALEDLVAHIKVGECILFLGAGVHASPPDDSRYSYPEEQRPPSGRKLAESLAKECRFKQQFPEESPCVLERVSLWFEITLGRKRLVDSLEEHLMAGKKPSPALKMLAALPFKIIVTTNYDRLLEEALRESSKTPFLIVYNQRLGEHTKDTTPDPTAERPLLFKMHGDLDQRESIVITDEDYITFIQRMTEKVGPVPGTVYFRMKRWPTLFVGYSFRDYNLRLLFRMLRWRLDPSEYDRCFSVDRSPDPLILKVWQDKRDFVTFVAQDLWTFVPWLYKTIKEKEYPR
jgi:hypothetical protein